MGQSLNYNGTQRQVFTCFSLGNVLLLETLLVETQLAWTRPFEAHKITELQNAHENAAVVHPTEASARRGIVRLNHG